MLSMRLRLSDLQQPQWSPQAGRWANGESWIEAANVSALVVEFDDDRGPHIRVRVKECKRGEADFAELTMKPGEARLTAGVFGTAPLYLTTEADVLHASWDLTELRPYLRPGAETCQGLIERHRPNAATLLDFGCGTGRDLEILAKRFECVGVDLQPGMVDHARQTRPWLDIRTGDMRTIRLGKRVDAVTCLGNSLAYIHDNGEIGQVFATFAAHARPGSVLILCSPVSPITRTDPTTAAIETPHGPAQVTISYTWDLRTQINTMHRHWEFPSGDRARDEIRRRVLFPRELERYASGAGFEIVDMADESRAALTGPIVFTVARYTCR